MGQFFIFCDHGGHDTHGTQTEPERRRLSAIELVKQSNASLPTVARWVGAAKASVSRWDQAYQKGSSKALFPVLSITLSTGLGTINYRPEGGFATV